MVFIVWRCFVFLWDLFHPIPMSQRDDFHPPFILAKLSCFVSSQSTTSVLHRVLPPFLPQTLHSNSCNVVIAVPRWF